MAKKFDLYTNASASMGTQDKWYKGSDMEIVNNNGKTDIRIDKEMLQASVCTDAAAKICVGVLVHITDENGASMTSSITSGTTDDAALETLLNQWKDNVWMTDFRILGTGSDEMVTPVINLEADTRRLLKPGQILYAVALAKPLAAETSKTLTFMFDNICWYSAAAQ